MENKKVRLCGFADTDTCPAPKTWTKSVKFDQRLQTGTNNQAA